MSHSSKNSKSTGQQLIRVIYERLDTTTRKNMVNALNTESKHEAKKKLFIDYQNIKVLTENSIEYFISKKSMEFFTRFKINSSFLKQDPGQWENDGTYVRGKYLIKAVKVVNDTAERSVKLMEDYHGLITKDESQMAYVMQCVHEHRSLYPNCTKKVLSNHYES